MPDASTAPRAANPAPPRTPTGGCGSYDGPARPAWRGTSHKTPSEYAGHRVRSASLFLGQLVSVRLHSLQGRRLSSRRRATVASHSSAHPRSSAAISPAYAIATSRSRPFTSRVLARNMTTSSFGFDISAFPRRRATPPHSTRRNLLDDQPVAVT